MDTEISTERLEKIRKDLATTHGVQPNQIWIRKAWIELNSYGRTVLKTSFDVVGKSV